ncbi:MAG: glycoside hydrolase family 88 protein [Bacteroidales bacterium]|nr:glycoside hydrolase family 88 protein [Bacteroidales bacterium]
MRIKGLSILALLFAAGCSTDSFIRDNVGFAAAQIDGAIERTEAHIAETGKFGAPIDLKADKETITFGDHLAWQGGFFQGSLWYLYELTGDEKYAATAQRYTESISDVRYVTDNHDVGFICMSSFGQGMRLKGLDYKDIIVQTAESLMTRFREVPGLIQSWQASEALDRKCPVIIDNMMNLELLFKATELTGDKKYFNAAVSHADRTLKEHFRPDGSCWHVVDYDPVTGEVRKKVTAQGYSDDSVWSRGQAWAIYGYAMAYRCTGYRRYIDQSLKTFEMMRNHPNMAGDRIPYWDMCSPEIPDTYRDVSTASIIASALYEISTMDVENPSQYKEYADEIMTSLASPSYRARLGENGNFILMHSVGSIPHNSEIDVPLNYADYYFLEALKRKRDIER